MGPHLPSHEGRAELPRREDGVAQVLPAVPIQTQDAGRSLPKLPSPPTWRRTRLTGFQEEPLPSHIPPPPNRGPPSTPQTLLPAAPGLPPEPKAGTAGSLPGPQAFPSRAALGCTCPSPRSLPPAVPTHLSCPGVACLKRQGHQVALGSQADDVYGAVQAGPTCACHLLGLRTPSLSQSSS